MTSLLSYAPFKPAVKSRRMVLTSAFTGVSLFLIFFSHPRGKKPCFVDAANPHALNTAIHRNFAASVNLTLFLPSNILKSDATANDLCTNFLYFLIGKYLKYLSQVSSSSSHGGSGGILRPLSSFSSFTRSSTECSVPQITVTCAILH